MGWSISLLGDGLWTKIQDFITGIFAIIPQFIYFFYTCIASLLDMLQFLIRKLVGLDVYYVNGVETEGDILSQLINGVLGINGNYSALSTVFWSMIIFGVMILILGIIIAIIKAHYNYDAQKARPSFIIGKALKSVALMAVVPIVSVLGVYLSNIFLKALDSFTSTSSSGTVAEVFSSSTGNYQTTFEAREDEWGNPTYVSYDFFGSDAPTASSPISGILFKATAHDCNRVRYGGYTAASGGAGLSPSDGQWSNCGIFSSNFSSPEEQKEAVASMIDYAFANNLRLAEPQTASILKGESITLISSFRYLQSAVWYLGTIQFKSFSKFNVGLVWYYYNLWQFNILVGFIGVIIALVLMSNIVFGVILRLLECTALMICLGPVVGMSPLEDGAAFKEWRKLFTSDVLAGYGAIAGMNLSFMILPYMQELKFFNSVVLNSIMEMIIAIVLLIAVKQVVGLISGFVGGGDAAAIGKDVKANVTAGAKQAGEKAGKVAGIVVKIMKLIPVTKAAATAADKGMKKIKEIKKAKKEKEKAEKETKKLSQMLKDNKLVSKARQKYDTWKTNKYGEGEDISEEDHEKLVAEEEEKLNNEKNKNQSIIDSANGADKRTSEQNLEEANRMLAEADALDANAVDEDIEDDFEDFLDSSVAEKDFGKFMASRGKDISGKDIGALANQLKKERNNEKYSKFGKKKVDSEKLKEINAPYTEKFASLVSERSAEAVAAKRADADALKKAAEAQKRNAEIDERIAEMHTDGFVMEGKRVIYKPQLKGLGNEIAKFSGEIIKSVNAEIGLDKMFKKLDSETGIVDSARLIFKDFAQSFGVNVQGIKTFNTRSELEKEKERGKQEKLTTNIGVSESNAVLEQTQKLSETLKKFKK